MGAKGGRPVVADTDRRDRAWRRMITRGQWELAQVYLEHHGRAMSDVIWNGPSLREVLEEAKQIKEDRSALINTLEVD
jgi:hypothetical protein|tara:strand:- start:354 stop:587 length:234 start_codon:yes stop_codon:yes gene_type:complete